jgi:class 3 adenylate cyclase
MVINVFDLTNICDKIYIHSFYNIADTLCKFICNFVISYYNEEQIYIRENMDLQSVNFVSYMIKNIKQYEMDNTKITPFCNKLIQSFTKKFTDKMPKCNNSLKLELLTKILPFGLDRHYVGSGGGVGVGAGTGVGTGVGTGAGSNKEMNCICILFVDIVNYTELANKYKNSAIIFKLLNNIYHKFDTIIKKYSCLQKIETIGDAYMVVGDIYRSEFNHKQVIKELILMGLEFLDEIKNIDTPDGVPLCIRIGATMGNVNIGILGNEIPRLCIVGNAVNVAARLQSTAEPDSIQVSYHIHEQTQDIDFGKGGIIRFRKKENVFLKNIGIVTTYILKKNDLDNSNAI